MHHMAVDGWLYWSHCMCGNEIILTNGFSSQLFCFWLFIQLLWPGIIESSSLDCRFQRYSKYTNKSRCIRLPYRLLFIKDIPQRSPRPLRYKRPSKPTCFPGPPFVPPRPPHHGHHAAHASIALAAVGIHPPTALLFPHSDMPSSPRAPFGDPQFPPLRNCRQPSVSIGGPPKVQLASVCKNRRLPSHTTSAPAPSQKPNRAIMNLPKEMFPAGDA